MGAGYLLLDELREIIDGSKAKKEAFSEKQMGYKQLIFHFKNALGDDLALPPNPNTGWIIRQVTRARELGLDEQSIQLLCASARRLYPKPPYDLEFLIRAATRLLHEGPSGGGDGVRATATTVHTGRPEEA